MVITWSHSIYDVGSFSGVDVQYNTMLSGNYRRIADRSLWRRRMSLLSPTSASGWSDVAVICGHITIFVVGQHGVLCEVKSGEDVWRSNKIEW